MKRAKFIIATLLAIILLTTQVLAAGAAPAGQESTPIIGNVDDIVLETNPDTDETTVLVTLTNEMGTQTIRLSLETAIALGLVTLETGTPVIIESAKNTTIEIDPSTIISGEPAEEQHPVGSALSDFFSDLLGVDYDMIMEYHNDGVGFGVIAQALWMTNALEGDADTFALILEAKQNKDYSLIMLPDGSTPQNWGQFRKAVMGDREKAKENLGAIMSGRAEKQEDGTLLGQGTEQKSNKGNGNSVGNSGNNANDKGKNKSGDRNGKEKGNKGKK